MARQRVRCCNTNKNVPSRNATVWERMAAASCSISTKHHKTNLTVSKFRTAPRLGLYQNRILFIYIVCSLYIRILHLLYEFIKIMSKNYSCCVHETRQFVLLLTNTLTTPAAAFQYFSSRKHPEKLGQFDLFWVHHSFFMSEFKLMLLQLHIVTVCLVFSI